MFVLFLMLKEVGEIGFEAYESTFAQIPMEWILFLPRSCLEQNDFLEQEKVTLYYLFIGILRIVKKDVERRLYLFFLGPN